MSFVLSLFFLSFVLGVYVYVFVKRGSNPKVRSAVFLSHLAIFIIGDALLE